jgi:membrane protease YdiL (CAAX protease family)
MLGAMRPFFIGLACVWLALIAAGFVLFSNHEHSYWIITAALPACLLEFSFYLASVLERTRKWIGRLQRPKVIAALLWVSALLPYFVFSLGAGTFRSGSFLMLAALCGVLAYWYAVLPRHWVCDVGFLVLVAVPVAARIFGRIYLTPDPHIHLSMDVLGHLAWIRLAIVALLVLRGWQPGAFGIWPSGREWGIGAVYFLVAILPLSFVATELEVYRFAPSHAPWWQAAGLALALSEELFFRGVIERALLNNGSSPLLAILISAVLYGCSHLWHSHFPNWQDALVTTVLGVACGMAYASTGSVRTPMVTHALTVLAALLFFR